MLFNPKSGIENIFGVDGNVIAQTVVGRGTIGHLLFASRRELAGKDILPGKGQTALELNRVGDFRFASGGDAGGQREIVKVDLRLAVTFFHNHSPS
jgi:hypothetical protein